MEVPKWVATKTQTDMEAPNAAFVAVRSSHRDTLSDSDRDQHAFSRSAFSGTALRVLLVWSQLAATAPSFIDERDEVCCRGSLIFLKFALS